MGVDLKGKTIEQIDAIDQAIRVVTASIRSVKMADYAVSLEKRAEQIRKTAKIAQEIAQKEALEFYTEERYLWVELRKVTGKEKHEVEAEGLIPLLNPESKYNPVHEGRNAKGEVTTVRDNHLELHNDNISFEYKNGKAANFSLKLRIGKPEFVGYRKAKAEKMPTDVTISTKGQRQKQTQRLANKAKKQQTAAKITKMKITNKNKNKI